MLNKTCAGLSGCGAVGIAFSLCQGRGGRKGWLCFRTQLGLAVPYKDWEVAGGVVRLWLLPSDRLPPFLGEQHKSFY